MVVMVMMIVRVMDDDGDNQDSELTSTCEKSVCMGAPMMMSSIPSPFISLTATE